MAGRVGDDELALRRREEAVGDVDSDALLPLSLEAVDQKREVDVVAGGAASIRDPGMPGVQLSPVLSVGRRLTSPV